MSKAVAKYSVNNVVVLKDGRVVLINEIFQKDEVFFYDYQSDDGIGQVSEDEISHVKEAKFYP
ncbi:hypothetical protein [Neisseria dentiae]|uniref:hypothetical protein n=1 Tax=Neisseria dentiae TaxID=194197 RepID=UPI0035A11E13